MTVHNQDDDEVWIVYNSGDFVAIVASESDAENICIMLGEWWTWKHFVGENKGETRET